MNGSLTSRLTWQDGKAQFLIRDTFSNDCFSSVMLVFGDVYIRDQIGKTLYPYPTNKKLGPHFGN